MTETIAYNHDYNQIDPRDNNIVTWSSESRRFITEASTLKANDIGPESYWDVVGRKPVWKIWLWSEKFQQSILYAESKALTVRDPEGELVANVFVPTPPTGRYYNAEAYAAAKGTSIHILND